MMESDRKYQKEVNGTKGAQTETNCARQIEQREARLRRVCGDREKQTGP